MTRYEFFQKVLTQLEALQATLNSLRETVKEQLQDADL
jgi:hypothetical protein